MSRQWLQRCKLVQLHRVATLIGSPCSGPKADRIYGINQAVNEAVSLRAQNKALSVVSIDMGIRNLAYCHLTTQLPASGSCDSGPISLDSWQRVEIATTLGNTITKKASKAVSSIAQSTESVMLRPTAKPKQIKESFEPEVYAKHAYGFIKDIIDRHKPTHVLIERQRFRSGGAAAVQEWTLRVGVFEAMMYATLRTLNEQHYCDCKVVPMSPNMVNRFWFSGQQGDEGLEEGMSTLDLARKQSRGNRIKIQKIQIAADILKRKTLERTSLAVFEEAQTTENAFVARLSKKRTKPSTPIEVPKLDDLSDSLLQGLAWLMWQKNRLRLNKLGEKFLDV